MLRPEAITYTQDIHPLVSYVPSQLDLWSSPCHLLHSSQICLFDAHHKHQAWYHLRVFALIFPLLGIFWPSLFTWFHFFQIADKMCFLWKGLPDHIPKMSCHSFRLPTACLTLCYPFKKVEHVNDLKHLYRKLYIS